jgi:hypothetical protein
MSTYPSWRYHKCEQPKLVKSAAEEQALGAGWEDSPAAFLEGAMPKADPLVETKPAAQAPASPAESKNPPGEIKAQPVQPVRRSRR